MAEYAYLCTAKCNTRLLIYDTSKDMATTTKRKAVSFRLPSYLLEGLKAEGGRQHRSVNNLVEVVLLKSMYSEPNAALTCITGWKDSRTRPSPSARR